MSQLSAPSRASELLALQGRELTSDDYDILLRLDESHANRNKPTLPVEMPTIEDTESTQPLAEKLLALVRRNADADAEQCKTGNKMGGMGLGFELRACLHQIWLSLHHRYHLMHSSIHYQHYHYIHHYTPAITVITSSIR